MWNIIMKILSIDAAIAFSAMRKYQKKFKRLPEWYLFQTEKTATTSPYELLVFKETDLGKEIFLIKRPENDPHWPNEWHFPGTIQRYWDDFENISMRLAKELGLQSLPSKPTLLSARIDENIRGRHTHLFYLLIVDSDIEYTTGTFFPLGELPGDMILYQRKQLLEISKEMT
ncbi:hypothetical protein KJ766_00155 [Patescibacteria group bacterium]|nr:hypothetical protein [Patescibacteria group bacterium]